MNERRRWSRSLSLAPRIVVGAELVIEGLIIDCSSAVLTELPYLSTVGILGRWSIGRLLVDLSTKSVAE
jgi:hypothetical protein